METSTQPGDGDRGIDAAGAAQVLIERRAARAEAPKEPEQETAPEVELEADQEPEQEATEEVAQQDDEQIDADESEEATHAFQTIDEVAEAAGMDVQDFLDTIKARTNVDGELGEVSLAQLLKGHQLESSFTRKNQQWVEQTKAEKAALEAQRTELGNHLRNAGLTFQMAQQQLTSDFQNINWSELEKSDPQNYVLKRQQFGERQAQLNQAIQQATVQAQQSVAEQQRMQEEADQSRIGREHELMLNAVPEWKDDAVFDAERVKLSNYLNTFGFGEDDMNLLTDHRFILMARAAMTGKGTAKTELRKKLKQAPKLVKGGEQTPRGSGEAKAVQALKQKLKKTGSASDAGELILAKRQASRAKTRRRR